MTDELKPTQADIHAAAIQWCREKERETSCDDIRYFESNWKALPGLRERVEKVTADRKVMEIVQEAMLDLADKDCTIESQASQIASLTAALRAYEQGHAMACKIMSIDADLSSTPANTDKGEG